MERALTGQTEHGIGAKSRGEWQFTDLWLSANDSPHTRRSYARTVREFLAFAGKPLARATRADVQAYKDWLVESGLKPSSTNQRLAAVKSLLSDLHRTGSGSISSGPPSLSQ